MSSRPWPLYDRVVVLYRAAERQPPSRGAFTLHEIANEQQACRLLDLIEQLMLTPNNAVDAVERILIALNVCRRERWLAEKATRKFLDSQLLHRLDSLAKKGTRSKLRRLFKDARRREGHAFEVTFRAIRLGVRKVFGDPLPPRWLTRLGDNPEQLQLAAAAARRFLMQRSNDVGVKRDARGRKSDRATNRYGGVICDAFLQLTGKPITYTRETDASPEGTEAVSGAGVDFMRLALSLIDGAATATAARYQIDRACKHRSTGAYR